VKITLTAGAFFYKYGLELSMFVPNIHVTGSTWLSAKVTSALPL
jgi:hypothetical protein